MAYVKLTALLRIFYETGLAFIPVVEIGPSQESSFLGFLSRRLIDKELADIERSQKEYDFIPDRLLVQDDLPESLLEKVRSDNTIPVYNSLGQKVTAWDSASLLKNWNDFKNRHTSSALPSESSGQPEKNAQNPEKADDGAWIAGRILSTLEYPLFVTDLHGNTLFYNGSFEERILNQSFKKSVKLTETFFRELNRSLLALSLQRSGPESAQNRVSWIESLKMMMEVKDLYADDFLSGYVYSFHESGSIDSVKEIQVWLESGRGLTEILEDIESHIIYSFLKKHGQNISHAASALQMSRTTLQSRMKMLRIDERFSRVVDTPVRRIRKSREDSVSGQAASVKKQKSPAVIKPVKKTRKKI